MDAQLPVMASLAPSLLALWTSPIRTTEAEPSPVRTAEAELAPIRTTEAKAPLVRTAEAELAGAACKRTP